MDTEGFVVGGHVRQAVLLSLRNYLFWLLKMTDCQHNTRQVETCLDDFIIFFLTCFELELSRLMSTNHIAHIIAQNRLTIQLDVIRV